MISRASLVSPALARLAPVGRGVPGRREGPLEVDPDDGVPLVLGHREQHPVAQDPGVADHDVEPAEGVDGLLHEGTGGSEVADVGGVGDRLAAGSGDLVDDVVGRPGVAAGAVALAAEVVDDDLGAVLGEHQRVLATDPPPPAGDDADPTFTQCSHVRGR